ncbi:hypothetical protein OCGS_1852 [Oceaniovalibus guishaninsula JLT2003]|uniref:Haem-binding uptake Tiki superfamily ChaN domain-containing protein n=1 Tax=Oceaniovalibus guishaninsula JLT2003 TaxID=1231392 RepID=K2GMB0_9RHOB|nr:ChaN family lipoprotein [Oceaniovalibus guishaninsula]EKE43871.1 hypothetical protein OCGS_1852 [Oceaniovalibus guishaninsula JLT2003]
MPLDADVVLMGEVHDNPVHHVNQAIWLDRMKPAAVVFEQLPPHLAQVAESLRGSAADVLGAALEWEGRGWPDFEMYHPVFIAAGDAAIFGAEVAGAEIESVFAGGLAASRDLTAIFGLDAPLSAEIRAKRLDEIAQAHCNFMPEDSLAAMLDVQRLRDAALAEAVIAAWEETGGPVAVVTGNGHARDDWGVPSLLQAVRPDLSVIALGQLSSPPSSDVPFDDWVVAPYLDADTRGDPCDALR